MNKTKIMVAVKYIIFFMVLFYWLGTVFYTSKHFLVIFI